MAISAATLSAIRAGIEAFGFAEEDQASEVTQGAADHAREFSLMSLSTVLRIGLALSGVPDQDIWDLQKSLPGAQKIVAAARKLQPLMHQAAPHIEALEPILIEMWPIIKAELPEIEALLPTIEEFLALAQANGQTTKG